jgi:hypothetical protein
MEDEVAITVIATGFGEGLDNEDIKELSPLGLDGTKSDFAVNGFAPANKPAEPKSSDTMLFGEVEGLKGTERTLQDILSDKKEDDSNSKFEIPDFLK